MSATGCGNYYPPAGFGMNCVICGLCQARCMAGETAGNGVRPGGDSDLGGTTNGRRISKREETVRPGSSRLPGSNRAGRLAASPRGASRGSAVRTEEDPGGMDVVVDKKILKPSKSRTGRARGRRTATSKADSNKATRECTIPRANVAPAAEKPWGKFVDSQTQKSALGTDKARNSSTSIMYRGILLEGTHNNNGHGSGGSRMVNRDHGAGYNTKTRGGRVINTFNGDVSALPKTVHLAQWGNHRRERRRSHEDLHEVLEKERSDWIQNRSQVQDDGLKRSQDLRNARPSTADFGNGPAWPHRSKKVQGSVNRSIRGPGAAEHRDESLRAKQATMLARAADSARAAGNFRRAEELFQQSADIFETLRISDPRGYRS